MKYKVGDRVEVQGAKDKKWYKGTVINVNPYREFPYAIELDIDLPDYVFPPEEYIRRIKDN